MILQLLHSFSELLVCIKDFLSETVQQFILFRSAVSRKKNDRALLVKKCSDMFSHFDGLTSVTDGVNGNIIYT